MERKVRRTVGVCIVGGMERVEIGEGLWRDGRESEKEKRKWGGDRWRSEAGIDGGVRRDRWESGEG